MFTTKDTNTAKAKWFAIQDINARAAAAYAANTAFFDSWHHQQRVSAGRCYPYRHGEVLQRQV